MGHTYFSQRVKSELICEFSWYNQYTFARGVNHHGKKLHCFELNATERLQYEERVEKLPEQMHIVNSIIFSSRYLFDTNRLATENEWKLI